MNAITTPSQTTPASIPTADRGRSHLHRLRRIAGIAALSVAVLLGAAAADAAPASAQSVGTIGGCYYNCNGLTVSNTPGGTLQAVDCQAGRITIWPMASAQAGYNGQWVSYRYELRASNGYIGTSGWSSGTVAPYSQVYSGTTITTPLTSLPTASFAVVRGLRWQVRVQYRWYTTSGWRAGTPQYPNPSGYHSGGGTLYTTCGT